MARWSRVSTPSASTSASLCSAYAATADMISATSGPGWAWKEATSFPVASQSLTLPSQSPEANRWPSGPTAAVAR